MIAITRTGAAEINSLGFQIGGGLVQDAVYHIDLSFAHNSSALEIKAKETPAS